MRWLGSRSIQIRILPGAKVSVKQKPNLRVVRQNSRPAHSPAKIAYPLLHASSRSFDVGCHGNYPYAIRAKASMTLIPCLMPRAFALVFTFVTLLKQNKDWFLAEESSYYTGLPICLLSSENFSSNSSFSLASTFSRSSGSVLLGRQLNHHFLYRTVTPSR